MRFRTAAFLASAALLAGLLVWAFLGLPGFGHYPGPYGDKLNAVAVGERHASNVVAAVIFDYRGFDTLIEETILFTATTGVALILRELYRVPAGGPEEQERENQLEELEPARGTLRERPERSDAVRSASLAMAALLLLVGSYVVLNGHISVGGGFQGGVVLAGAWLLAYLAGGHALYHKLAPKPTLELLESIGIGIYLAAGLIGLLANGSFLWNWLPLGQSGKLLSGGTIPVVNTAVGLAVTAAFALIIGEFIEETSKLPAGEEA